MCRKAKFCSLLGTDPTTWSTRAPLPPPDWFEAELLIFRGAVEAAALGNLDQAIDTLKRLKSDEMRFWFDEHGQMAGRHRARVLGVEHPPVPAELDPRRAPTKYERAVFERDSYTCRYCGLLLIAKQVMVSLERQVGSSYFCTRGRNRDQHGIVHGFKPVADHVFPHKRGGRTDLENLVTACPACNYGKEVYTLEQMGLDDPRNRPPLKDGWDGLRSLLPEQSTKVRIVLPIKRRSGVQLVPRPKEIHAAATEFWRSYWTASTEYAPELEMPKPEGKTSGATFISFNPNAFPKGVNIIHKLPHGNVDLQFAGFTDRLVELEAKLRPTLTGEMTVTTAGKSGVIRIKVPVVDVTSRFETQHEEVRAGISAARILFHMFKRSGIAGLHK